MLGGVDHYSETQPTRDEVEAVAGPSVLIFGTDWCGYCRASARHVDAALAEHPEIPVVWVEDGKGRALGRSFRVKLWPTLIFLQDGAEVARVVRPTGRRPLDEALSALAGARPAEKLGPDAADAPVH